LGFSTLLPHGSAKGRHTNGLCWMLLRDGEKLLDAIDVNVPPSPPLESFHLVVEVAHFKLTAQYLYEPFYPDRWRSDTTRR